MGNKESSTAEGDGNRKQEKPIPKLYHFVDMYGGGELIPWMKYAKKTGDSSIIDEFIETKVLFISKKQKNLFKLNSYHLSYLLYNHFYHLSLKFKNSFWILAKES